MQNILKTHFIQSLLLKQTVQALLLASMLWFMLALKISEFLNGMALRLTLLILLYYTDLCLLFVAQE